MKNPNQHEFALYWPQVSVLYDKIEDAKSFVITDSQLVHRIVRVLRLKPEERIILFDQTVHIHVQIQQSQKDTMECLLISKHTNPHLSPTITLFLPLLKRDALEQAVYNLVEVGVSFIQLLQTTKTQRKWGGQQEADRLKKISIAAAEQSKYFAFPEIMAPQPFEAVKKADDPLLFCDPVGMALFDVVTNLRTAQQKNISVLIGPEGDLTHDEKTMLKEQDAQFMRLTPTVLRAQFAAPFAVGVLRSLL